MNRKLSLTREDAVAELRAIFASVYNELRRRGHEVIVAYDEPGDPRYIPQIIELDGLKATEFNLRFHVKPWMNPRYYDYGVVYIPTHTARAAGVKQQSRTLYATPRAISGPALADWVERNLRMVVDSRRSARS